VLRLTAPVVRPPAADYNTPVTDDIDRKAYLVGGAVRDQLLGLDPRERDWVVVGATPAQMEAAGFKPVGRDFPVFLHPESGEEYALARTERKQGHGYKGFVVHAAPDVTLEQDLSRRDLTINAIARDAQGRLVDPYGGQRDLAACTLRHVSPAFVEDPLRVLRVARFAARFHPLGFTVADETLLLMAAISDSGELGYLVAERVWREIELALAESHPDVFFRVLRECGALARLLPELDRLFGVPQPPRHHPEIDTGLHSLLSLQQAVRLGGDPTVRFAALLHDVGKGLTPASEWPRHIAHEKGGLASLAALCERLKVPNEYRQLALLACEYHTHIHRAPELRPATVLKVIEQCDGLRRPQRFRQLLLACEADARGRTGLEEAPYPQAEVFNRALDACLAVRAADLAEQGLAGPELGAALHRQRLAAINALLQQE